MQLATKKITKDFRGFPVGLGNVETNGAWIGETIKQALEDFNGFESTPHDVEALEFQSRSGFIPYSHNRGGYQVCAFSDLMQFFGSGTAPKDMQALIDSLLNDALKDFVDANPEVLFQGIEADEIGYHSLYEAGLGQYAEMLSEFENEALSGDYSSVLEQIRVMYHGENCGLHSLTVFGSLSYRDAPYHRTSDQIEEVLITFKNEAELKAKLSKAIELASKALS